MQPARGWTLLGQGCGSFDMMVVRERPTVSKWSEGNQSCRYVGRELGWQARQQGQKPQSGSKLVTSVSLYRWTCGWTGTGVGPEVAWLDRGRGEAEVTSQDDGEVEVEDGKGLLIAEKWEAVGRL